MKKILLSVLFTLLFGQLSLANIVTIEQARNRAALFFSKAEIRTKATAVSPQDFKLIGTFPEVTTKASGESPAMYIFDRSSGGYAIVSGDDVARPILGYSLVGRFPMSDIPENMRALLQWYADIIAYAREHKWESVADVETESGLDPANSVQLQTAQWDQWHPFNDLVPEIDGQKPPIGCVATAIAIIMQYHKWPQKGAGKLPAYDYIDMNGQNHHIGSISLGHEYNWNKMPDGHSFTQEEEAQVARLLYDVAVMCKTSFNSNGSSSSLSSVQFLSQYFAYDRGIRWYTRYYGYTDSWWEQTIKDEIKNDRPVLYAARADSRGGHAFVIDGFNDHYFSINYGWSGSSISFPGHNTDSQLAHFYTLTPVEGHEEDLAFYYELQEMAVNIIPQKVGQYEPSLMVYESSPLPYVFEIGKPFYYRSLIKNQSLVSAEKSFCFGIIDKKGGVKEIISKEIKKTVPLPNGYSSGDIDVFLECKITKEVAAGDTLLLLMKDTKSGNWTPVMSSRRAKFVFTDCSLAEMVNEIGYVEGTTLDCDIYFKVSRDACWCIIDSDSKILKEMSGVASGGEGLGSVFYFRPLESQDCTSDMVYVEIKLPSGDYGIRFRNPLTEETMEIKMIL